MEIKLERHTLGRASTKGRLSINGRFICSTLEPGSNQGKGPIPAGRYPVVWKLSPRLGKLTPRVLAVPGFEGILIHSGNKPTDSAGCILCGTDNGKADWLDQSRASTQLVYSYVRRAAEACESIWLTVK